MVKPLTLAIRAAGPVDAEPVAGTLAVAFASGPVAEWLIPDEATRRQVYGEYSRLLYDHAATHGLVHVADAYTGAAVWFGPDAAPPAADHAATLVALAGVAVAVRFGRLDDALAARVPAAAHAYLAFLGVHPTLQRRGIGSALLRHRHHQLDLDGVPAFLIATSYGGRALYLRHGYVVSEEFAVPGGPPLWSMWRDPLSPT